jgi:gamma-glutamyltranspeptidase/glutathione hydrolase
MRDFHRPGRSSVHALNGMAATSHPLATLAALDMLRQGGNAVDAAIAASAVLCVVEPMMTGIGGDCFVLYAPVGGNDIIGFNGSGRAAAAADAEALRAKGWSAIPAHDVNAITVPGAVDAWDRLMRDHGKLGLEAVFAPAIRHAEEGFAVSPRVAHDWALLVGHIKRDADAAVLYLKDGAAPSVGDVARAPALAATLRAIGRNGRDAFYDGPIAARMVKTLRGKGSVLTEEDFAATSGDYVTPLRTAYAGHELVELPPNGQGLTALLMLNILRHFDMASFAPDDATRLHLLIEAQRLAYEARDRHIADPDHMRLAPADLLADEVARALAARIDPARALKEVAPHLDPLSRDTIYLSVVDRDRNAVSFINSTYMGFGSGIACAETGVIFQNRGAGFVLDAGHPNCLGPRKRPFHTIIPAMAVRDGRVSHSFGVMGGAYQPMGHVHVFSNMADCGLDPQAAVDAPRLLHTDGHISAEAGITPAQRAALTAKGHEVKMAALPHGGAQVIALDWARGGLMGGSDPRKDGCALGY